MTIRLERLKAEAEHELGPWHVKGLPMEIDPEKVLWLIGLVEEGAGFAELVMDIGLAEDADKAQGFVRRVRSEEGGEG